MENITTGSTQAQAAAGSREAQLATKLYQYLDTVAALEVPLRNLLLRQYGERAKAAEGKRCVVVVTGMPSGDSVLYFQITNLFLKRVSPFENFDTLLVVPLEEAVELLEGLLAGNGSVFGEIIARGRTKILGNHSPYDIVAWGEVVDRLARNINSILRIVRG